MSEQSPKPELPMTLSEMLTNVFGPQIVERAIEDLQEEQIKKGEIERPEDDL